MIFPSPEHYLYNLIAMSSPEAKRLWRRSIKEHFDCTCVYCGTTYEITDLTLDHVHPRCNGGEDLSSNLVPACLKCNQEKGSLPWQHFISKFNNPLREHIITSYIS